MTHYPLVGYTVEPFQGLSPSLIVAAMRAIGVAFVELNHHSLNDAPQLRKKMGNMQAAFHLPFFHDDGYDFSCRRNQPDICSLIEQINKQRVALRLRHVIVHPPEGEDQSDEAFSFLCEQLKKLELPVYLENVFSGKPELFMKYYERMQQALGRQTAGICYDACHFLISGQDPLTQWAQLHHRIGCVHLSDCQAHEDSHLPFHHGGRLPIAAILAAMKHSRFSGTITLEIKPPSLEEVQNYLASYLLILKHLHFQKYLSTRIRLLFIKPILSYLLA